MNLRRNISSHRGRRDSAACHQARKVAARLRRPLGEGSGPLSPPLPGRAPAAPHHVGGAAAVPAAGLGFRNGKVHVPCGRARPGPDSEGHSGFARSPPLLSTSPQPRSPFWGAGGDLRSEVGRAGEVRSGAQRPRHPGNCSLKGKSRQPGLGAQS